MVFTTIWRVGIIAASSVFSVLAFVSGEMVAGAVCLTFPLFIYWYFSSKTHQALQHQQYIRLGLTPAKNANALQPYYIGQHEEADVKHYFASDYSRIPCNIIQFSITRGLGKHRTTHNLMGFEFTTTQVHHTLQIRTPFSTYTPLHVPEQRLEGTEFRRWFTVFSADPRAPYYFLDPDSMADLIDLRQKLQFPMNMDIAEQKILIFIDQGDANNLMKQRLTVAEVLTNTPRPERADQFLQAVQVQFGVIQQIFELLDYKLR